MTLAGARRNGAGQRAEPPRSAPGVAHPDLALAVVVVGVLVTVVDTTIVVLALPHIQRSLHAGLASAIWAIVGYLLVVTVLSTQVGRLGTSSAASGCTKLLSSSSWSARSPEHGRGTSPPWSGSGCSREWAEHSSRPTRGPWSPTRSRPSSRAGRTA